jgi:hypothetical protein
LIRCVTKGTRTMSTGDRFMLVLLLFVFLLIAAGFALAAL